MAFFPAAFLSFKVDLINSLLWEECFLKVQCVQDLVASSDEVADCVLGDKTNGVIISRIFYTSAL